MIIGIISVFLLLPVFSVHAFVMTPYGVVQVIDLDNGINWIIIANYSSFWEANDYDQDGVFDLIYFEGILFSTDGQFKGFGYVEVNYVQGYVWVGMDYINGTYLWVMQYQVPLMYNMIYNGDTYIFGGYALGGYKGFSWIPSSVIFGMAIEPSTTFSLGRG